MCKQNKKQSIDQLIAELKRSLNKSCAFGNLTESLKRDRIICDILDTPLQERLLHVGHLSLEKSIQMCKAAETVEAQDTELNAPKGVVHAAGMKEHGRKKPPHRAHLHIQIMLLINLCAASSEQICCLWECHNQIR